MYLIVTCEKRIPTLSNLRRKEWKGFNMKELRLQREGGERDDRRKIHSNYSGSSKV